MTNMAETQEPAGDRTYEDEQSVAEKKRLALNYLMEAWEDAAEACVDLEILAHVGLFRAFADLVDIYGEEPAAELAETLPKRIRSYEFSRDRVVQ